MVAMLLVVLHLLSAVTREESSESLQPEKHRHRRTLALHKELKKPLPVKN